MIRMRLVGFVLSVALSPGDSFNARARMRNTTSFMKYAAGVGLVSGAFVAGRVLRPRRRLRNANIQSADSPVQSSPSSN